MNCMQSFILIVTCILFSPASSVHGSENTNSIHQQGVAAYIQGDYTTAIELFNQVENLDGMSAPLLYNLGTSYAQNGQTGLAIANLEKALRLAPGDSDIRGNLELLRKEKGIFLEQQPVLDRFINLLDLNQWTILLLLAFAALTSLQLAVFRFNPGKKTCRIVLITMLTLLIISGFSTYRQYQQWDIAVIITPETRLLISPFATAGSTGIIQEGRLVTPIKAHYQFYLVQDRSGRKGWLPATSLAFIAK